MLFLVTYFAPARNEQLDQQGLAKTPPWGALGGPMGPWGPMGPALWSPGALGGQKIKKITKIQNVSKCPKVHSGALGGPGEALGPHFPLIFPSFFPPRGALIFPLFFLLYCCDISPY